MRTKPTKDMKKATRRAKASDYARMVVAASEVVMQTRNGTLANQSKSGQNECVVIEFPYFVKLPKEFPKGTLIEKTERSNVYKINAVRLLSWLYKNGYSKYDAKQLVNQTKNYERLEASIDRMFET